MDFLMRMIEILAMPVVILVAGVMIVRALRDKFGRGGKGDRE